jgi:hypothetical protein
MPLGVGQSLRLYIPSGSPSLFSTAGTQPKYAFFFFSLSRSFCVFSARQAGCPKKWPISSPMTRSPSSRRPLAYSTRTAMVSFLLCPFFFPRFPSLFYLFILFLWFYLLISDPFSVFYYESTNCSFGFYVCMFLLEFSVVDLGFSLGFGLL